VYFFVSSRAAPVGELQALSCKTDVEFKLFGVQICLPVFTQEQQVVKMLLRKLRLFFDSHQA
jgi:hypothetical protein